MVVLDRVDASDIGALWPHLEPFFQRACEADPTDLTPDIIRREALEDRRHVWTLADADHDPPLLSAFTTRIDGDVMLIGPLAGDEIELWLPLLSALEGHAKAAGITKTRIDGRPGWQRVLKPFGYRLARVTLQKEI